MNSIDSTKLGASTSLGSHWTGARTGIGVGVGATVAIRGPRAGGCYSIFAADTSDSIACGTVILSSFQ